MFVSFESEDFSYVLERVPGAITNLSTRPENGPTFPNHSPRMLVNESALATGIAMHVAVALRFLKPPSSGAGAPLSSSRRRTPKAAFQTLLGLAGAHGPTTRDMLYGSEPSG